MTDNNAQQGNNVQGIEPDKLRRKIAERAYFIAEKRGFATGHDIDDWLAAEQELNKQYFYWFQEEW